MPTEGCLDAEELEPCSEAPVPCGREGTPLCQSRGLSCPRPICQDPPPAPLAAEKGNAGSSAVTPAGHRHQQPLFGTLPFAKALLAPPPAADSSPAGKGGCRHG